MCGIVGFGGPLHGEKIAAAIKQMNDAIEHRGPDDESLWAENGFGFGMRRLSIIDLAGGHQPMWDKMAGIGIVYNGEVYNYRALRKEMERVGESFDTTSDTEVVLKSLALKGTQAPSDWNGMFAVACWNKAAKKLILIRDRIGIKPLYYFWDGTMFGFSSEIKALPASGLFQANLNRQAIWDYLTFRYVPDPETIWQYIRKLPPGHILEWSPGTEPKLHCYWQSDVLFEGGEISLDKKLKEFENLFLDSVEQQFVASDVPVGVFLSGGLDSSCIAAAAVELGHKQFHTFSIGFDEGGEYSELAYAKMMAKHIGANYHEVIIDQSTFLKMLPEMVRAADEPLADLSAVPLLAVARLARDWVKVVLSGEGADEILAGYNFDTFVRSWKLIKGLQTLPPFLLNMVVSPVRLFGGKYAELGKRIADTPLSKWNASLKLHMTKYWRQTEKRGLWPDFDGLDSDRILDNLYAGATSEEPLDQMLSVYQKSWLVEDLLMKADKMTMATSLELRVPFLDHRLVEWSNRLPTELKVRHAGWGRYVTKYILRRFVEKRLPEEIITRPKRGFPVPVYRWLQEERFSCWAKECLLGNKSRLKHIFSLPLIKKEICKAREGNLDAAHKTWLLIALETWLGEYNVDV